MPPLGQAVSMIAQFMGWELGVGAICLALILHIKLRGSRFVLWLSLNILISGFTATVLSFLGWNSSVLYLSIAAVMLLASVPLLWKQRQLLSFQLKIDHPASWLIVLFILALLLGLAMRPIEEIDSVCNLHSVMNWFENRTTPYEFPNNYVSFWELTYLPGFVLTRSDLFVWFQSLKPVILLGLLLLLIARELELPARWQPWLLGSLLAFPHLWLTASGVSTIKNDMIAAVGQAMIALVCIRGVTSILQRTDALLLGIAAVFVSVKFSGPVYLAAGVLVAVVVAHQWIWKHRKAAALTVLGGGALWLATVGHYYLANFISHGNPFHPFQINSLFLHLPGLADLSYSSILHNLNDSRLWSAFFLPRGGLSPAGVLFPFILAAILVWGPLVLLRAGWRRRLDLAAVVALYEFVIWGVYIRSYYSASGFPGDLQFVLNDLNSVRYVEGALLVVELFFIVWMVKRGLPDSLLYLMLAAQGLSRAWLTLRRYPDWNWLFAIALAMGIVLLLFRVRPQWKMPCAIVSAAVALAVGIVLVDRRRPVWLERYQSLYMPLYDAAPSTIYLVDEQSGLQPCLHFPLMGRRLQHSVETGNAGGLAGCQLDYIAWLRKQDGDETQPVQRYQVIVDAPEGVLYQAGP